MLFDAASGDYWLLSPLAGRILHALEAGAQVVPENDGDEDWSETLERLRQVGLIDIARS